MIVPCQSEEDGGNRVLLSETRHVESLLFEVAQTIRYGSRYRKSVGFGQPAGPITRCEVRQEALGDTFPLRVSARVVLDNENTACLPSPNPARGVVATTIQRGMPGFMDQDFFQEAIGNHFFSECGVDVKNPGFVPLENTVNVADLYFPDV